MVIRTEHKGERRNTCKYKPPVTRFAKDNITSLKAAGKSMLEQLLLPEEHLIDRMRVK